MYLCILKIAWYFLFIIIFTKHAYSQNMEITISQLRSKIAKAKDGIDKETDNIIKENKDKILDYIRTKQLYEKGVDANNKIIGTYKRTYTRDNIGGWGSISKIVSAGLPKNQGSPYNFVWSGYTTLNMDLDYSNFKLTIFNKGNSATFLESKYSKTMFEMSDENKYLLRTEIIVPNLTKYLKSIFG